MSVKIETESVRSWIIKNKIHMHMSHTPYVTYVYVTYEKSWQHTHRRWCFNVWLNPKLLEVKRAVIKLYTEVNVCRNVETESVRFWIIKNKIHMRMSHTPYVTYVYVTYGKVDNILTTADASMSVYIVKIAWGEKGREKIIHWGECL